MGTMVQFDKLALPAGAKGAESASYVKLSV